MKGKQEENPEAKARAAGIVMRQQYLERPINIACTGKMCWCVGMIRVLMCRFQFQILEFWTLNNLTNNSGAENISSLELVKLAVVDWHDSY